MDKYDTLEYSRVKGTAVSVCLRIYLCAFKNTNKLSGIKILILILMSTNLVITSFCGITHVLLICGIDRTIDVIFELLTSFHKKRRNIEKPRVPECSWSINTRTLPSHRYCIDIYFSNHVKIGEKVTVTRIQITSQVTNCTTHKFHLVSNGLVWSRKVR